MSAASPPPRRWLRRACALALLLMAGAGGAALALQQAGVAPRTLGPYLERRSAGHNPLITSTGAWAGATLVRLDRGAAEPTPAPRLALGAGAAPASSGAAVREILVASSDEALRAIAAASPGDAITFVPGTYRFARTVAAQNAGSAAQPVVVRAQQPGTVLIEFAATEGFKVSAPYWRFENLAIRGVCAEQARCEHAFHVVGGAVHFAAVNNTVTDFNAHFKINGEGGRFPDDGLIESNTLANDSARHTYNPVTPIDLVAASGWTIRRNVVSDFVKAGGDRISYGAFFKGAGQGNVFERNIVWCEHKLAGWPGVRVGLSLGGGGTGKPYCRDRACITEQQGGIIRDNLVLSCSDAGIYLNSAAQSKVVHNTLLDTAGLQARYPTTSADVEGNIIEGAVRSSGDAIVRLDDNLTGPLAYAYVGYHPLRALFAGWRALDLAWAGTAPRRSHAPALAPGPDLCGAARPARPVYGAFEDFGACLAGARAASASSATSSSSAAN